MIEPLKDWQDWGFSSKPECLKKFSDGENHHCWLISAEQQHWVVKQFEHSFNVAKSMQELAADYNLAPAIRFAKEPILLMEYLVSKDKAAHSSNLNEIAKSLAELHQKVMPPVNQSISFDIFSFANDYLVNGKDIDKCWHRALMPALDHFVSDDTPQCFCHNDLVLDNIIIGKDEVRFIDWEYASLNNPWFDLAAIIVYAKLNEAQSSELLAAYKKGWDSKVNDKIFISAQISLLWLDLVWHSARFASYRTSHKHRFIQLNELAVKFGLSRL